MLSSKITPYSKTPLILAPVDKVNEVERLIRAGADELYCGLYTKHWAKRPWPNARAMFFSNLTSFQGLEKTAKIASQYNIPVYLCINARYNSQQYSLLEKEIKLSIKIGVAGFIITDLSFLYYLKSIANKTKIILSTLGTCFNSETINFFCKLGVNRIILPRQLSLEEISKITRKVPNMEFETFILNITCRNINGFCLLPKLGSLMTVRKISRLLAGTKPFRLFLSSQQFRKFGFSRNLRNPSILFNNDPQACRFEYYILEYQKSNSKISIEKYKSTLDGKHCFYCAACSIFHLRKLNIKSLKIIGRGFPTERKIKDVLFVNKMRKLSHEIQDEKEFTSKGMELYQKIYKTKCKVNQCHYPHLINQRLKMI
jgi:putative protease